LLTKDKSDVNNEEDEAIEHNNISDSSKRSSKKISKLMFAGILLIAAGTLSIMVLITYVIIDYPTIGSMGIMVSFFPILGGIFALLKKGWLISLFGGIVGILFSAGIISIILALVAFLIIVFSRKEFQQNIDWSLFKRKKED